MKRVKLLELLRSHDVAYTAPCACGGDVVMGTDGEGHAIESCLACRSFVETPRALPALHPLFVAFYQSIAADREALELERVRSGFARCASPDCSRRVGSRIARWCFECAQERRRTLDRQEHRVRGGHQPRCA